jgi:hypothetical protein
METAAARVMASVRLGGDPNSLFIIKAVLSNAAADVNCRSLLCDSIAFKRMVSLDGAMELLVAGGFQSVDGKYLRVSKFSVHKALAASEALHLPPAAGRPVSADLWLWIGARVELHSLATAAFNGLHGEVLSLLMGLEGRHLIALSLADGSTKILKLKPCNLRRQETLEADPRSYFVPVISEDPRRETLMRVRPESFPDHSSQPVWMQAANRRNLAMQGIRFTDEPDDEPLSEAGAASLGGWGDHSAWGRQFYFPSGPFPTGPVRRFWLTNRLHIPTHIDASIFQVLAPHVMEKNPATHDFKYFTGDPQPWRNGDDAPVFDPAVIRREEACKAEAEAEDAALGPDADEVRTRRGIRVDFLLAMTFALGLFEWKTWEVVRYLVKPATEGHGRCPFTSLPFVKPFTAAATVFMSHCWGGRWGDLVAAAAGGGRQDRVVWIDVLAVRNNLAYLNRPTSLMC